MEEQQTLLAQTIPCTGQVKKYRINETKLDKAVAMGIVGASVEDGSLYLEDSPPYGQMEKLLRQHVFPNWGWYLLALIAFYILFF